MGSAMKVETIMTGLRDRKGREVTYNVYRASCTVHQVLSPGEDSPVWVEALPPGVEPLRTEPDGLVGTVQPGRAGKDFGAVQKPVIGPREEVESQLQKKLALGLSRRGK